MCEKTRIFYRILAFHLFRFKNIEKTRKHFWKKKKNINYIDMNLRLITWESNANPFMRRIHADYYHAVMQSCHAHYQHPRDKEMGYSV